MGVNYKDVVLDGKTSTGTANAVIIDVNSPGLYAGQKIMFKANLANTSAVTVQVGDRTPVALKKNNDVDLASGDIELGQYVIIIYNATDNVFEMVSQIANAASIVPGSVGTTALADDAVTNDKLNTMARGTIKVGGVAGAPTDLDANDDGKILVGDGTDVKSVAVSGDITLTNAGVTAIGANKVLKSMVSHEVLTVSIAGAVSGTATAVTGGQIIGWYVTAITGTESVKTIDLAGTTVTVTLTGSDTATVKVVVLKAS